MSNCENDPTAQPKPPAQPLFILTGMKPGQSFEEFKKNTIAVFKARGFFAGANAAPSHPSAGDSSSPPATPPTTEKA